MIESFTDNLAQTEEYIEDNYEVSSTEYLIIEENTVKGLTESGITQKSLDIPEGVTKIGDRAFYSDEALESVNFPSTLTEIHDDAFWGCTSLRSVIIPERVTAIGSYAFAGCSSLASVTILSGQLVAAGVDIFSGCCINELKLTDNMDSIPNYLFYKATFSDTCEIVIPATIKTIGEYAFYHIKGLKSFSFASGSKLETIGLFAFDQYPLEISCCRRV